MEESEHLDPTIEINVETVKKRAVWGVVALTGRTFIISIISLVATALLTVFLDPSQFGVFWVVSAVVNFLAYFSDVGLAAAIIQKKEEVSEEDLKTTFTVQQILVIILLVVLYFLTPLAVKFYSLDQNGVFLLYSLGISLFLSSLKTIPSAMLERRLEFGKLILPQVLENLVYNIVAVVLAWKGFGVTSFTIAVLARGVVGLIAIYIVNPWVPGIAFSGTALKKLLTFGIPYQINTFLAVIKDDGMTAVLGGILGTSGVGFLGWAQKWAKTPLRLFMDNVLKVTFPAFARMQNEKAHLERAVTRSVFFVCLLIYPSLVGILVLAPMFVDIIPRYSKWIPALLPLYLIGIDTVFGAATTPLTNLLNSIGKIKTTFKLMIMWTVLTWALVPFLSLRFGVNGAAVGYAIVSSSSVVAIYITKKYVNFSITDSIAKPFVASILMGAIILVLRGLLPTNITSVWIIAVVGSVSYALFILVMVGKSIVEDVKRSAKTIFSKE